MTTEPWGLIQEELLSTRVGCIDGKLVVLDVFGNQVPGEVVVTDLQGNVAEWQADEVPE